MADSMPQHQVRRKTMQLGHGLIVALALALSACASSEQVRDRQAAAQAAETEEDDAKCKAQGYEPDSPGYVNCRDRLAQKRAEEHAAELRRREDFQRTLGEGTSGLSGH
jgi:hypothetical protein